MDFLIQNVRVWLDATYQFVDVQISQDRISAISPAYSQPTENRIVVNGQDKLLLPGFVNAHTHSSQIWQRGLIPQLPLELWLADVFDSSPTHLEQFYLAALRTAVDTLLSGGTCLMDHAYLLPNQELETVAALVKSYREVGIRALIAPLIQDQPFVAGLPGGNALPQSAYPRSTAEILAMMEQIIQQFHQPETGISIAVGPTGFHRCSDQLLEGCIELSQRYGLCRHIHLLETRAQKLLAQERYSGSAVTHLKQMGFLNNRTSLAHAVWLDDAEIQLLAETKATVVHNPVSNLRLGSGIAPVLKYRAAGINLAFGCDGAASNDAQDLLEAIKLGTILHAVTDPDYQHWLTPYEAIEMAALGGARGVGLADLVGSLSVGKTADLVLYDLTHPSLQPCTDPIQLLVLGRPSQVVERVWVNGKPIVIDGKVATIDAQQLNQNLLHWQQKAPPQFQTIKQVEPHYRKLLPRFD
ncbi:MAG: amidohydrolase [Elainella sp. C42_A2020_010]|nr:amidohydrolase [Elainella sp. C42_A2020_010]RNJ70649.1 MAG: amidohydrolase [Leptolyngbya sp. IPPAS B-1204]